MIKTKKQILEEKKQINESILSIENVLMAAGFIPIIGEVADVALIILYLIRGQKLYAALMLIALIPSVGDILVKPIIKSLQLTKGGGAIMKTGKGLGEFLSKNPDIAKKFGQMSKYVNSPQITKTVNGIEKVNRKWGSSLRTMLDRIGGKTVGGLKSGYQSVVSGGSFGKGLKDYYRGERLSKYFAKKGVLPQKGISMWWQNVLARGDRKKEFRKFIMSNNMLSYFGVPSLSKFEHKLSNDEEFQKKLANDPRMSDFIAKNSEESDFREKTESNTLQGLMSLPILKMIANKFT
jgi:hypothetical protein